MVFKKYFNGVSLLSGLIFRFYFCSVLFLSGQDAPLSQTPSPFVKGKRPVDDSDFGFGVETEGSTGHHSYY